MAVWPHGQRMPSQESQFGISNQSSDILPPGHCDSSTSKVSSHFLSEMELDYKKIEHPIQSVAWQHQQGLSLPRLTLTQPKDNEINNLKQNPYYRLTI